MGHRFRLSSFLTAATLLSACLQQVPPPSPSNAPDTQGAPTINTVVWELLAPGLERRTIRPNNSLLVSFTVLRIDPALFAFRTHYRPDDPLTVTGWRDALPGVVALINANFFDRANRILGLLIADGVTYGESYRDRGGMFYIDNDGNIGIRSMIPEPYQGEAFAQAVQAFPVLVTDGTASFDNSRGDSLSRRTAIGIDGDGRVLWIVSSSLLGLRLTDLSAYLPTTDLGLVDAFNLDGGGSTMLYTEDEQIPSFDPVPAVLAIYAK